MKDFIVTEGVQGTWYYHISKKNEFTKSLCGAHAMITSLPLSSWGIKSRLGERFCDQCKSLFEKEAK